MNTKNTASQPKVANIADDAEFIHLLESYRQYPSAKRVRDIASYLDSKLRAPADQAASGLPFPKEFPDMPKAPPYRDPAPQQSLDYVDAENYRAMLHLAEMQGYPSVHCAIDAAPRRPVIDGVKDYALTSISPAPQQSLAPAAGVSELRRAVREMTKLLEAKEWPVAIISEDVDAQALEVEIACLVSAVAKPVAAEGQVSAAAPRNTVDLVTAVMDQFGFLKDANEHQTQELCEALESALRASEGQAQTSAAVELDAKRYRWMSTTFVDGQFPWPRDVATAKSVVELEAAVDRAIAAQSADKPAGGDHG